MDVVLLGISVEFCFPHMGMLRVVECYPESKLWTYVCGQLSDNAADEIDKHVSKCHRCQNIVDGLCECPQDLPEKFIPRRELGGGGFGDVFLCHDSELERVVAIKRIREVTEPSQWLSEARNASQVSHQNVVTIHEVGHNPPHLVMDYVPGEDLSSLLQNQTCLLYTSPSPRDRG